MQTSDSATVGWPNATWTARQAECLAQALERGADQLVAALEGDGELQGIARLAAADAAALVSRLHYLRRRTELAGTEAGATRTHAPPAPRHDL